MPYRLYTYFRSSASYRVRIALSYKQIDYTPIGIHLRKLEHRTPEYLAANPQGLVPTLEHDGARFTQSLAIIEYLNELVAEPPLLPAAPNERAIVRAMAQAIACDTHPLCNLRVLQYLRNELALDEEQIGGWYKHWVAQGLEGLEGLVAQHGTAGAGYCFGNGVTLADVCLVPQLHNARRFDCDLAPYPMLVAIDDRLRAHPAFLAAQPDADENP
jgi:maleylacetoacetate isomerase